MTPTEIEEKSEDEIIYKPGRSSGNVVLNISL